LSESKGDNKMRVYVDQSMCTGTAVCEALAPEVFFVSASGLSTVRADGEPVDGGGGPEGVEVAVDQEALVREAATSCPGACIHVREV
jgi:ferredoxin